KTCNGAEGIVNARTEAIVAVGATLAGIPLVDRVDVGGLRTGDRMTVDGDRGTVELPDIRATPVVSVVLRNRGRILVVRRSEDVGSFRGRWSAISGYLEGGDDPRHSAVREVRVGSGVVRVSGRVRAAPLLH